MAKKRHLDTETHTERQGGHAMTRAETGNAKDLWQSPEKKHGMDSPSEPSEGSAD